MITKKLIKPINAGSYTLSLAHFMRDETSPSATTAPHVAWPQCPSGAQPKPTSGSSSVGSQEGAGSTSHAAGSRLIWGHPTAVFGGDGCCCELGWDKWAAELIADFVPPCSVHHVFSLIISAAFPGLAGLNNHSSRHKAVCQNYQGLLTKSGDRSQRTFSHFGPEQKYQVMEMWWLLQKWFPGWAQGFTSFNWEWRANYLFIFLSSLDCFYCSCSWPYFGILLSNKWKPGRGLGTLPEHASVWVSLPAWMLVMVPCPSLATSSAPAFCCLLGCAPLVLPTHSLFMAPHLVTSWMWDLSASSTAQLSPLTFLVLSPGCNMPSLAQDPAVLGRQTPLSWSDLTQHPSASIPRQPTQRRTAACFSKPGGHRRQCWQSGHSSRHWVMQQFVIPAPFSMLDGGPPEQRCICLRYRHPGMCCAEKHSAVLSSLLFGIKYFLLSLIAL